MAFLKVEDLTAITEVTVFPIIYNKYKDALKINSLVKLKVKVEQEEPIKKCIANFIELVG